MSTDTATAPATDEHDGHAHPTDKLFIQVAIILAVITAVEVAWTYLPWPDGGGIWTIAEVGGLMLMMGLKFFMVASVFMHLKFDSKLLTGIFYFGLILAVLVYLAVLTSFALFNNQGPPYV